MFSFRRASGKAVLIATIDEASVGVAIVHLTKNAPTRIRVSEHTTMPRAERSPEQTVVDVTALLDTCVSNAIKAYAALPESPAIKSVYAILRAPWSHFRTVQAEESYSKAESITNESLAQLVKKSLEGQAVASKDLIAETGLLQASVNGYPTAKPLHKKGTRASVVAFETDINEAMRASVLNVLSKQVTGRKPIFKSSMHVLLAVLRAQIPNIHRYMIIDIGDSATHVATIRKEAITDLSETSMGRASILQRITGGGIPEGTLTQLRMLAEGSCATDACNALKDSLARAEPELAKVFGETFGALTARRRLPNKVMLVAPAELAPWLRGFFARIDFAQFTATLQPFEIESLSREHLQEMVVSDGGIVRDTGIALTAAYVHILEENT